MATLLRTRGDAAPDQRPDARSRLARRGLARLEPERRVGLGLVLAVVAGLLLCAALTALLWLSAGRPGGGAAALPRAAAGLWLVAHGSGLELAGASIRLVPLGITLTLGLFLSTAARALAGRLELSRRSSVARLAAIFVGGYAGLVLLVGALAAGPLAQAGARPSPVRAAAGAGLLAGAAVTVALARSPSIRAVLPRPPRPARTVCTAAAAATATILAGGALSVAVALGVNFWAAATLSASSAPGAAGGAGLLLLQLALVPNAVIWGAAYAAGPGVLLAGGTVGPVGGGQLSALPALPLLSALPALGADGPARALPLLVPVLSGVVAGMVIARSAPLRSARTSVSLVAAAALLAGAALGALAAVSGGSLGANRLAALGPVPLAVAGWVAAVVGLAAGATVGMLSRRGASRAGPPGPEGPAVRDPR